LPFILHIQSFHIGRKDTRICAVFFLFLRMRWLIIGTGNVAWHLAQALTQAGETCTGVVSREASKASAFAESLPIALPAYTFEALSGRQDDDIVLLAVADDAIIETAEKLACLPAKIAVHTSGTRPLDALEVLRKAGWRTGIFYPLQTLSKQKAVDWRSVPMLLESDDFSTLSALEAVARGISDTVIFSNSEKRLWLHLSAVLTSNFMHHLCVLGEELLQKQGLSLSLLQPLLQETLAKALLPTAPQTQTGPARRNDQQTIEKHLGLLEDSPHLQRIYKALTESILERYRKD
jgi:predicted short-subunit dehydrogenase-like oxidoreductase (DUF2520 family)